MDFEANGNKKIIGQYKCIYMCIYEYEDFFKY